MFHVEHYRYLEFINEINSRFSKSTGRRLYCLCRRHTGANTQGATLEEARTNLIEAINLVIKASFVTRKICKDLDIVEPSH
jgi:hypothetical protein